MKVVRKISNAVLPVLLVASVSGCRVVSPIVVKTAEQALTGNHQRTAAVTHNLEKQLTPTNSGPGLVVFEPTSSLPDANFAKGCGRWLFIRAAGSGDMGKTAGWGITAHVARSFKLSNFQTEKVQALQYLQLIGVPYAAIGKLDGSGAAQKLTYQIWKADGKQVGASLSISGSRDQIVKQLPGLARRLNNAVGGTQKQASVCELTASELAALGSPEWKPLKWLKSSNATLNQLKILAPRSELAAVLLWRNSRISKAEGEKLYQQLTPKISQNPLVLCDFARNFSSISSIYETATASLLKQYPNNALLHATQREYYMSNGAAARSLARQSAEMEVRAQPKHFLAWHELGEVIEAQSQDVRRSRFANQVSSAEWQKINALTPLWLEAMQKAVSLNPLSADSWTQLAVAYVFNNDNVSGDQAMTSSMKLDPLNRNSYSWAFQMYQPKWSGNQAKFFQYANQAIANAAKFEVPTHDLFEGYRAYGMANQIPALAATLSKANPQDYEALYEYGADLHYRVRAYRQAETVYKQVLAIQPQHARCLSSLADLQTWVHGDNKAAEALYRKAIAADNSDGFHHANLARLLNRLGRRDEARSELDAARSLGFRANHPVWQEMGERP